MKKMLISLFLLMMLILIALPAHAYAQPMPEAPAIKSLKALSKQRIQVQWTKAARATSYQLEYSPNPSMRPTYTTIKTKRTRVIFKCPYSNTRVYVRICAVNTKNHFSQYGFWSSTKSVYLKALSPVKLSASQLKKLKKTLRVPASLKVTYSQGKPYYWTAGDRWLTTVSIYNKKKQLIAGASCDSFTGAPLRNIGMYGFAGYR